LKRRFFKCPPIVADILTKLTIKDGILPQGTKNQCAACKPRFLGTGAAKTTSDKDQTETK